jgi:glycosyltransferase involved in cell wall biosynthesis
LPFGVHLGTLKPKEWGNREERLFFKGKIDNFGLEKGPYESRIELAAMLQKELADLFVFNSHHISDDQFHELMGNYKFHINLPSFSDSMTLRAFEAMGSGGLLFQFRPKGRITKRLFQNNEDLVFYDPLPHSRNLARDIADIIRDDALCRAIAKKGQDVIRSRHSLSNRINAIVDHLEWRSAGKTTDLNGAPSSPAGFLKRVHAFIDSGDQLGAALTLRDALGSLVQSEASSKTQDIYIKLGRFFDLEYDSIPFIEGNGAENYIKPNSVSMRVNQRPTLVFDSCFFQIAKNGIARVWQSVIHELINHAHRPRLLVIDRNSSYDNVFGLPLIHAESADWSKSFHELAECNSQILRDNLQDCDLFLSSYYTHANGYKTIQIVHDFIPEIFGGSEDIWHHKKEACLSAHHIISVSESTCIDLSCFYGESLLAKTSVIPNGIPTELSRIIKNNMRQENNADLHVFGLKPLKYFVFVGGRLGWKGYKNALVVARAFGELKSNWPHDKPNEYKLCFVGGDEQIESFIMECIPAKHFHSVLRVSADDARLATLLSAATALVYPSIYEGFGLPVAEALCAGCPVIASNMASITEAGGDYPLYFNPFSASELLDHMFVIINARDSYPSEKISAEVFSKMSQNWRAFADCILDATRDGRNELSNSLITKAVDLVDSIPNRWKLKHKANLATIPHAVDYYYSQAFASQKRLRQLVDQLIPGLV